MERRKITLGLSFPKYISIRPIAKAFDGIA
jgi:hypothetical protein